MARTMKAGFADRLRRYLRGVRTKTAIATLRDRKLSTIDLTGCAFVITHIYNCLAVPGALDAEKQYHVGTTKVLHWLFPDLFLIIDSNVARAFRNHFGVKFRKWAPQGYSDERYVVCLREAQNEICSFGPERFQQMEPATPEARIFDKVAFILGSES